MANKIDLSFFPYLTAGALWQGIPMQLTSNVPFWQWTPALKTVVDSNLETVDRLLANGWERLTGQHGVERWNDYIHIDSARYLRLCSLLNHTHLLEAQGDYEVWARTADIKRAESN